MTKEDALAQLETLEAQGQGRREAGLGRRPRASSRSRPRRPAARVKVGSVVTLVVSAGSSADAPAQGRRSRFPDSPKAGKPVPSFDGSDSTDDGTIAKYYWEFGDGQTATGKSPSHTWAAPGTYEVTLWVTDDAGQQGSVTKSVRQVALDASDVAASASLHAAEEVTRVSAPSLRRTRRLLDPPARLAASDAKRATICRRGVAPRSRLQVEPQRGDPGGEHLGEAHASDRAARSCRRGVRPETSVRTGNE